jgi:hypothetical protein
MQQQQQQQDAEQQRDAAAGRRAAHLAPASVTSTPRVVETPREVARDLEMQDLVLQLQQARADALYWRSELEKFLQSYERLSGSMTRAAARLEERMQAQALRFRELRAQDVKKMHALARALQQSQLRHPRASSAAVAELAGSEAAASSDAHRVAGLTAHDVAAPSSALSTFFSGEELAQLHHQLSDARLQIFNLQKQLADSLQESRTAASRITDDARRTLDEQAERSSSRCVHFTRCPRRINRAFFPLNVPHAETFLTLVQVRTPT